jgi:hypothetical protein
MNKTFVDLQNNLKNISPSRETFEFIGLLGDASRVVKADKKNNVYVMRHDGSVVIARNTKVPNVARLPVLVGYEGSSKLLQVLRAVDAYIDPPYPNVPDHAELMHGRWGYDPVFVEEGQFLPGLPSPATISSMTISLRAFRYYLEGWHLIDNQVLNFTSHIPAVGARWTVAEIDKDEVITLRDGSLVDGKELLTPANIPTLLVGQKPLFAVMCYQGQSRITQNKTVQEIFDMRFSGVSSSGDATSIEWANIQNTPAVFAPDLSITDAIYPRKWLKFAPPTTSDTSADGYSKSDIWVDQSSNSIYICADDDVYGAVWIQVSGGGGGSDRFSVDGRLAVIANATMAILITTDTTISEWAMYLENTGTSGSTIIDVQLYRDEGIYFDSNPVSIFDDGVYDVHPEMAFDDPNKVAFFTPIVTDFLAGDVLILEIEQIAPTASDMIFQPVSQIGSGGSSLEVTDGSIVVDDVGQIVFDGATVTNEGGGSAKVTIPTPLVPFPDYASGVSKNVDTIYQAAVDGWLNVVMVGSYQNDASLLVGASSPPTLEIARAGDDINSYTKYAAWMFPIPKDTYYKVVNGWDTTTITFFPLI